MSVVDSSFLEWVEAIKSVNFDKALELALHSPSLLWHPIPFEESHYPHFSTHLQKLQHMKGISVPHFYAIQLLIVNLFENALPQSSTEAVLLSNLIEMAVAADLNTCFWGSTKNTTLHLASCLGQEQVVELLISQGALAHIPNSDGYVAIDFALTTTISDMLQQVSKHENPSINDSTVIKDNRFEQLRQLAEEGGNSSSSLQNTSNMIGKRQQSTRRYFQPGHLEARRKKVLQEDDNSATADESTRIGRNATNKRQQEVESLAKQSRVKNNPLFRKFEEQHQQQEYKQPTAHNRLLSPALETLADRRTSKGISSLKGRSFVSTSVFRQQEANVKDDLTINNSAVKPSKLRNEEIMDEFIQTEDTQGLPDEAGQQMTIENDQSSTTISNPPTTTQIKDPECTDTTVHNPISSDHPIQESVNETMSSLDKHNNNSDEDKKSINSFVDSAENMDDENRSISSSFASVNDSTKKSTLDTTRIPGIDQNRISHPTLETQSEQANKLSSLPASKESLLVKAGHLSVVSDTASDQWHDSYEVYPEDNSISGIVQRDSRKISSHGSLLIAQANTSTDVVQDNNWQAIDTTSVSTTKIEPKVADDDLRMTITDDNHAHRLSHETEESQEVFKFHSRAQSDNESVNTWPPPSPKSTTTSSSFKPSIMPSVKPMQEMELPSTHNDYKNLQSQRKIKELRDKDIRACHTNFVVNRLSQFQSWSDDMYDDSKLSALPSETTNINAQNKMDDNESTNTVEDKLLQTMDTPYPILPLIPEAATSGYGKIYIRMTSAHDILLPLPLDTTYVRCVISDGRQEYLSRYEVLGSKVPFRFECTMDTYPNMIISVALQVRPDPHIRPLSGFSRFFTSAYRQKKTLLGYVHPEEYIIGQTRFALEDMIPACNQKAYSASFDCFNSWFVKSAKDRRRLIGGQILKVIGQLGVDMLYLPVSDPSMSIPASLQECDLALRIRQWHGTCWRTGYLSTRRNGETTWKRYYFQLIGSRLLGYESDKQIGNHSCHFDITDALQLIVAAEQVLVDVGGSTSDHQLIYSQNPICEDNRRGFFRVTFSDASHIDCVCDKVFESELWVRTLRAMIGRVPLTVSASIFLD